MTFPRQTSSVAHLRVGSRKLVGWADRRVAYTAFPTGFLRARVAGLSQRGALRLSSLQLQADARERRPYPLVPRRPWWHVDRYDVDHPPPLPVAVGVAGRLRAWPGAERPDRAGQSRSRRERRKVHQR